MQAVIIVVGKKRNCIRTLATTGKKYCWGLSLVFSPCMEVISVFDSIIKKYIKNAVLPLFNYCRRALFFVSFLSCCSPSSSTRLLFLRTENPHQNVCDVIIIRDNFCIALFSDVLTALYNTLQHFLSESHLGAFCVHHTVMHHVTSCKAKYVKCMRI